MKLLSPYRRLAIAALAVSLIGPLRAQTWTQLAPTAAPKYTSFSMPMVFDAARGQTVLFVREGDFTNLSETWLWSGTDWTKASPASAPSGRSRHALAWDDARRQIVMFGGCDSTGALNDTWVWDGTTWTKKTPANSPSPRCDHLMAYDPVRQQTILYGGANVADSDGLTWAWDGTNWTKLAPAALPPVRSGGFLAWDPTRQNLALLQSYTAAGSNDVVSLTLWNGSNWIRMAPGASSEIRAAAFVKNKFLIVRNGPDVEQTAVFDGTSLQVLAANTPNQVFYGSLAYDPVRDRTVALALDAYTRKTQTWTIDVGAGCAFPAGDPSPLSLPAVGGTVTVDVPLPTGCSWTARSNSAALLTPTSGTGPTKLSATFPRSRGLWYVTVSGWSQAVLQDMPPCTSGLLPPSPISIARYCKPSYSYSAKAGEQISVRISGPENRWVLIWNEDRSALLFSSLLATSPSGTAAFRFPSAGTYQIEFQIGGGDSGIGTVDYVVYPDCYPSISAHTEVQALTLPVTFPGALSNYPLTSLTVELPQGCAPVRVTSGASWLSVGLTQVGPGATNVLLTPLANSGGARSTTVSVGPASVAVSQAAAPCGVTLNSSSASVDSNRNTGEFTASAASACQWAASSNASWLQVFPLSGSAPSALRYTVFPNFGTKTRTATITVAGATFNVTQAPMSGTQTERFVRLLYFNFFGRMPSPAELGFQANSGQSRAQLALNFFNSQEFTNGGRFVAGLYVGLLNRDAEYGGWLFQRDALANGINTHDPLIRNFLNSTEFRLRNDLLTDGEFVILLYRQILLRQPTAAEVIFQSAQLAGGTPRSTLALSFLFSQEFIIGTGPRLTAFLSYAGLLQRDPTPDEFDAAKATAVANLLSQLVNSAEFNTILE